jgi:hypothetical protein
MMGDRQRGYGEAKRREELAGGLADAVEAGRLTRKISCLLRAMKQDFLMCPYL